MDRRRRQAVEIHRRAGGAGGVRPARELRLHRRGSRFGAIVAARLSEDPGTQVLLIEAGPDDKSLRSRVPLGFAKIIFDQDYIPAVLMIGEKGADLMRGRMTAAPGSTASRNGAGALDRVAPSRVRDLMSDVATVVKNAPGGSG